MVYAEEMKEGEFDETVTEEGDFVYSNIKFSKKDEAEVIEARRKLMRIGGFSPKEIFVAGVDTLLKSPKYLQAVDELRKTL